MANLPVKADQSSLSAADERFYEAIADNIAAGLRPDAIARKAYPKDLAKRKAMRRRIWHMVRNDVEMARRLAERARGEHLLALVSATRALGERASRGRPDAVKLLYESSGFHNPRVKHEHSGEIKVKLDMPRPKFVDSTAEDVD